MSYTYLHDSLCDYESVLQEIQKIHTKKLESLSPYQTGDHTQGSHKIVGHSECELLFGITTSGYSDETKVKNKKWHYDCPTLTKWFEVHNPFSRLDSVWIMVTKPNTELPWHRDVTRDWGCHIPLDTNDEWFLELEGGQKIKAKNGLPFIFDAYNKLHRAKNPSLTHTRIHIVSFGILKDDLRKSFQ